MKSVSLLIAFLILAPVMAGSGGAEEADRLITVGGVGKVEAEPDEATIRLGAKATNSEVAPAKAEVDAVLARLLTALDELGINKQDINTSRLYIYPQYRYKKGTRERVSYEVTRYARIKLQDIDKLQALIEKSVTAGANLVEDIQLTSTREKALEEEALKLASKDARRRAEVLARQFNAGLGKIRHLSESMHDYYDDPFAGDEIFGKFGDDFGDEPEPATYLPGQIKITSRITAVFELEDARSTD